MTLRHYSAQPLAFDRQFVYPQSDGFKPRGLWLSVVGDNDWKEWCERNDFATIGLQHASDFALTPDANILHLTSEDTLRRFEIRYRVVRRHCGNYIEIDWQTVRKQYDGLIIAPYQWNCRLDMLWYYGWDCASGCVWNLEALQQIVLEEA